MPRYYDPRTDKTDPRVENYRSMIVFGTEMLWMGARVALVVGVIAFFFHEALPAYLT